MLLSELFEPLSEFKGNPDADVFGPTSEFKQIYGNYCGPGNRGGEPIDDIDAACQLHDMCYHYNKRYDPECDERFVRRLKQLLGTRLTFKQRYYANIMYLYFVRRLKKYKK